MTFSKWFRQPTTIAGTGVALGAISASMLGQISWQAALPILIGAAFSIGMPDNTVAKNEAVAIATDIIKDIAPHA